MLVITNAEVRRFTDFLTEREYSPATISKYAHDLRLLMDYAPDGIPHKAARVAAKKVFPHNLRHLFARTHYAKFKDIVRLADILGHSSIETTRIYTARSGKEERRQFGQLRLVL